VFTRSFFTVLAAGVLGCTSIENRLLYYPIDRTGRPFAPSAAPLEDVELLTGDGTQIHAAWCPCTSARGALLYCHGNAGDLRVRAQAVQELSEALEESVLIFDYPGYGYSNGEPSEAGCYAAATVAYDWLIHVKHLAPERILIYGESLGGGVAVDLASRRPHRALILVKTFTSIPDVAQDHFPWLPVRSLMTSRFDNLAKIGQCQQPLFIAQADCDRVIPFSLGKQLAAAAKPDVVFFRLHGQDHNDPIGSDFYTALRQFLATRPTDAEASVAGKFNWTSQADGAQGSKR
jgi:fermentation-respiration switch protein FrsA (DUF1100 family)